MKLFLTVTYLLILSATALAGDNNWKPVDPAQLALKASAVEKDADAEAIFWDVFAEISSSHTVFTTYIRIKIFTERGRELHSSVDLPYLDKTKIEDVAGRTIKADGTIVELNNSAIFERTVVVAKGIKIKAKSFALPAVEPGAIIEYRWREVRGEEFFIRLPFQRAFPVQSVKYSLKAPPDYFRRLVTKTFNGQNVSFQREKDNLYTASMVNVPGFHEEPDMPPKDEVTTWALIYFAPDFGGSAINSERYDQFKSVTKTTGELRAAASSIIGDAANPEQKIERLFKFCRSKIKHIDAEGSGLTASDRAKYRPNKTAADTLKNASGTGSEINALFAALAIAAGFDARPSLVSSRNEIFFDPAPADSFLRLYFMRNDNVAVKVYDKWRFFDPASSFVPYGMLLWQEEAREAMILGAYSEGFENTPLSPPERSVAKRKATLRLSEDGTLEGDARIEYHGHFAAEWKRYNADDSQEEREKTLRDEIKKQMSTAELSDIRIEGINDPDKPFVYAFHLRVPGYGQRTGKRLFFQPAFFQHGIGPRFTATERKHGIYFHYPWSEEDQVEITLPERFALDNAESIGSFPISNVGKYIASLGITTDARVLVYKRNFTFGLEGRIMFRPHNYQALKKIFDTMRELDEHMVAIKQGTANM